MTSSTSSKVSRIWSNSNSSSKSKKSTSEESASQFRHRFLLALQFYCQSPSLILNSDLPADLVEFVSTHQFPIEALAVILELKKGSLSEPKSISTNQKNQQKVTEVTRKLVESWMSSDSCAEALVSLSLGDEIPGVIAETANIHRLLFTLPECFHIPSEDFQIFLLAQSTLAMQGLIHGVKEEKYAGKIRSQVLASLLDRMFIRYYADSEQFFTPQTVKPTRNIISNTQVKDVSATAKPFSHFIAELASINQHDFVARRLVTKILLGFSPHTQFKFAKTAFLVGEGDECAAHFLFFPAEDFLHTSSWSHTLNSNIPLKTQTKSKLFWANWSHYIFKGSSSITQAWETSVKNWESLCLSSAVNVYILLPATYALIALAHQIKQAHGEKSAQVLFSTVKVFDSVAKCLDSTSDEKRACGMALAQVMGDLHTLKQDATEKKLNFTSDNKMFLELIDYYENGAKLQDLETSFGSKLNLKKKVEVLDSDDEIEDDEEKEEDYVYKGQEQEEFLPCSSGMEEEFKIDERILDYRSRKGKIPMYFSEFVEILVEGGAKKDEGEIEALKYMCIMKIPLLLSLQVRMDPCMAQLFVKCLLDFEAESSIDVPVIFALYELSQLHPQEVFQTFSKVAFDKDHYTSGHRMVVLCRLSEIIQLLSKSKCFSCYNQQLQRHRKELVSICPEFFMKYFDVKIKSRFCSDCSKTAPPEPKIQKVSEESDQMALTWREIVDKRIQEKTRYFSSTRKRKTLLPIVDEYAAKLVPIIWASLANKITSHSAFFLDEQERKVRGAPNDMILAQMFRVLGRILLGTEAACPHLGNISSQVGELARTFASHPDASVRQSVFALLAIIFTISDGANYVIELVSYGTNILEMFKVLRDCETNLENQGLLDHTIAYLAQAATIDYRLQFRTPANADNSVYAKLRVLSDIL